MSKNLDRAVNEIAEAKRLRSDIARVCDATTDLPTLRLIAMVAREAAELGARQG